MTARRFNRTMKTQELNPSNPSFTPARERLPSGPLTPKAAEKAETALQLIERKRTEGHIITCGKGDLPQYYDVLRLIGAKMRANRHSLANDEKIVMITLDKSRQNTINYLLGRGLGGDEALKIATDCMKKALYETFGEDIARGEEPYILRYSEFSDEFTIILKARGDIDRKVEMFGKNLRKAVETADYSAYGWDVQNGKRLLHTDLGRASAVFKHPELIATSTVGGSRSWKARDIKDDEFLIRGLDEAEASKLHYLDLLPPVYKEVVPVGEMTSPFRMILNGGPLPRGTIVEIKLRRDASPEEWESEARLLMKYVVRDYTDADGNVRYGSKKGLYEILANDMGRRLFNLVGNSRCNKIFILPVLEGAMEFGQANDVIVAPSDDLNFLYIGAELNDDLRVELARHVISRLSPGFMPRIKALPTDGLTLEELRPEFELMDIGMKGIVGKSALEDANLLINIIENVDSNVRSELFKELGGYNLRNLEEANGMFERIRTIRHMQDFTFVANAIGKEELVSWVWNFVRDRAETIRNRLTAFYTR